MKWVTRERPVIDRIACPWLIARFIDKQPEFLFVPPDQVIRLIGPLQRRCIDISPKVLRHALPNENERGNDRERQQDVKRAAGEVDPEIADGLARGAGEGAN